MNPGFGVIDALRRLNGLGHIHTYIHTCACAMAPVLVLALVLVLPQHVTLPNTNAIVAVAGMEAHYIQGLSTSICWLVFVKVLTSID